jgi:hypothetical protein
MIAAYDNSLPSLPDPGYRSFPGDDRGGGSYDLCHWPLARWSPAANEGLSVQCAPTISSALLPTQVTSGMSRSARPRPSGVRL